MYLKCFVSAMQQDKKCNTFFYWLNEVLQSFISKTTKNQPLIPLVLEFNIDAQQCFIKNNAQWKPINSSGEFTIHPYNVRCEIYQTSIPEEIPQFASSFPPQMFSTPHQGDALSFLYNTIKQEEIKPIMFNIPYQNSCALYNNIPSLPNKKLQEQKEKANFFPLPLFRRDIRE